MKSPERLARMNLAARFRIVEDATFSCAEWIDRPERNQMDTRRFVFITDTHIGCDANGYHKQTRYLDRVEELFDGLKKWIEQHDVSFVIHGGDVTDHGTLEEIKTANSYFDLLDVPVYVALGNHDLMCLDSMTNWWTHGKTSHGLLLPESQDCFTVDAGDAVVVVLSHHWHSQQEHYWNPDEGQMVRVDE